MSSRRPGAVESVRTLHPKTAIAGTKRVVRRAVLKDISNSRSFLAPPAPALLQKPLTESAIPPHPTVVEEFTSLNETIFRHYYEEEPKCLVPAGFLLRTQRRVTERMRGILVDWLVDVHYKFQLQPKTLFLSVNFLDRFLASESLKKAELQLSGIACLLIACKYEEIYFPELDDFVYLSDEAYDRKQVMAMESRVLSALQFELTVPTVHCFLSRFLEPFQDAGALCDTAHFLCEMLLLDCRLPSLLAASCLFLAHSLLHPLPALPSPTGGVLPPSLETVDVYSRHATEECVSSIERSLRAANPKCNASFRKYSRTALHKAAYAVHDRLGNTESFLQAVRGS